MQEDFYLAQWNNQVPTSPKRPTLDDRIRMLSDSPTQGMNANVPNQYPPEVYPYPMQRDMQGGMFPYPHPELYQPHHLMPPPQLHSQVPRYPPQPMNHQQQFEEFQTFVPPRYVNNSNLVEITQQKRERQRTSSSQAVQVGNVLEIVPSKLANVADFARNERAKMPSPEQPVDKQSQARLKRKADRERKRMAKAARKAKLRSEIQRYIEAGVTAEVSDDESLISLRPINIHASVDRGIVKRKNVEKKGPKKVLFKDGILPGESTSEDNAEADNEGEQIQKRRRKKFRKKRLSELIKNQTTNGHDDSGEVRNDPELDKAPAPPAPVDPPPPHLVQPQLKKITIEMFAAFPVNPEPIYYYIQKMQQANGFHQSVPPPQIVQPPRASDRFHYYKKQPPPAQPHRGVKPPVLGELSKQTILTEFNFSLNF